MKIKAIAEACMWLPGFSPEEDPNIASITAASASTVVHDPVFMAKAIAPVVNVLPEANIWPRLLPKTFDSLNGVVTKYQANVDAISLLRVLENDQRNPTTSERDTLNRYTGCSSKEAYHPMRSPSSTTTTLMLKRHRCSKR